MDAAHYVDAADSRKNQNCRQDESLNHQTVQRKEEVFICYSHCDQMCVFAELRLESLIFLSSIDIYYNIQFVPFNLSWDTVYEAINTEQHQRNCRISVF